MAIWLMVLLVGIILVLTALLLAVFFAYVKNDEDKSFPFGVLTFLLTLVFGIATFIVADFEEEYSIVEYDNIYSIRGLNGGTESTFFLGTGTIEEKTYYYVFVETDRGFELKRYRTYFTVIKEVDDGNYYIAKQKNKWESEYYILYVPKGTIVVQYTV